MELKKASRKQVKLKIGVFGPSGSGKTMSALKLAYGITNDREKIAVIDTENNSASLYSDLGAFNTIELSAPYNPERFIEAIDACTNAGMEVIIIDSISHEWEGPGGCLEIHNNMTGNSFQNRGEVGKRHKSLMDKVLLSPVHIILCGRTKQEYAMTEKNGKKVVEKMGMEVIQRAGLDYEVSVAFDIDIKHYATSTKDRTGLFMDRPQFIIDARVGKALAKRASTGEEYVEPVKTVQIDPFDQLIIDAKCEDIAHNCAKTYAKLEDTDKEQLEIVAAKIKNDISIAPIFDDDKRNKFYEFINLYVKRR